MKAQFRIMAVFVAAIASGATFSASAIDTVLGSDAGAQGTGGQVNFTGSITDSACDITTESTNQDVDLGKWASNYFKSTGTETTKTPFHIKVKDCPSSVTKVSVLFEGQHDTADKDLLAVSGGAQGVAIQLLEADESTKIALDNVSKEYPVNAGSEGEEGTADLTFYANYRATTDKVVAGDANGVANFEMVYN
jgi:P pilus assembly protein, pilin FimA